MYTQCSAVKTSHYIYQKKLFESQKKLMMGFETKRQQEVNKK